MTFRPVSRTRTARGFTLIELMITVAVIAILARIAMPSYLDYVKRGKVTEAFNQLTASATTIAQFYQDNRTYVGLCTSPNTDVYVPTTNGTTNFSYTCGTPTATTYTITATGKTGSSVAGYTYTLDQSGARTTTAAGTWPTSTACWIANKSGTCF